jgi:hypothetical protein
MDAEEEKTIKDFRCKLLLFPGKKRIDAASLTQSNMITEKIRFINNYIKKLCCCNKRMNLAAHGGSCTPLHELTRV